MSDEDKNFGGALVLDFRKWWRQPVQAKSTQDGPLSQLELGRLEFNFKL